MPEDNHVAPTAPKKRGRPPKAKQTDLPGVEGPGVAPTRIKSIEKLADIYVEKRDIRIEASKIEVEAKGKLIDALHSHAELKNPNDGTIRYEYDGGEKARRVIVLKPSDEQLKVKDVEAFEEVNVE